jgi:NTE family protein
VTDRIRVALALGGGGARGYAHIGVIQVLEERGFDVIGVSGTSMGALVGGLFAAGRLGAYTDWVSGLTQRDVLRLLDPSLRAPGAIRGEKIMARVRDLLAGATIERLPLPFTAVATDLLASKEVWFQRGPVDVAIRASIALPSFITPVMLDGRLLADGGMMNPIPIAPLSALQSDATVAVSLAGDATDETGRTPLHAAAEQQPDKERLERFRHTIDQVLESDTMRRMAGWFEGEHGGVEEMPAPEPGELSSELPPGLGLRDVMQLSLESLQSVVARYRLASYPPDVLISIPRNACRTLDFHRGAEMIELGRDVTEKALAKASFPEVI